MKLFKVTDNTVLNVYMLETVVLTILLMVMPLLYWSIALLLNILFWYVVLPKEKIYIMEGFAFNKYMLDTHLLFIIIIFLLYKLDSFMLIVT